MNPIHRSIRLSNIAALVFGLTLAACGGSPTSLEDEPSTSAVRDGASVHDNTEVIAQLLEMPREQAVVKTAATDRQPRASTSLGCALQAGELVPFEAEPEAQQASQLEVAPEELVPEPTLEGINNEPQ